MAQGLINNGVSVTKSFSPNQLELLADYTVSGSAITSYTFSGLKLNADEEVVLVSTHINTGTGSALILYSNGNTTASNYYSQRVSANSTTVSGVRYNIPYINVWGANNGFVFINTKIKLTNNGYFTYQSNECGRLTSDIILNDIYGTSTFTLSQITSLTITCDVASGINVGSRFQLYKVKGQVVQTWATT